MFCTYCNTARVENEAPCPNCGAPSPLLGRSQTGDRGTGNLGSQWGTPSSTQWSPQPAQQLSFDASSPSWQQPGPVNPAASSWQQASSFNNSMPSWQQPDSNANSLPSWQQPGPVNPAAPSWQQVSSFNNSMPSWQQPDSNANPMPSMPSWQQSSSTEQPQLDWSQNNLIQQSPPQAADKALLPVPYQQRGLEQIGEGRQQTLSLQLIQEHTIAHLIKPADNAPKVYVAPMFTKPRPIIPKYRAISGLVSVLIVSLLLCAGAGYFAQTHGAFAMFNKISGTPPHNIQNTTAPILPPPPENVAGPAHDIIPSAGMALRIDEKNQVATEPKREFQANTFFYVTYYVQAPEKDGNVKIKWYTNNTYYDQRISDTVKAKENKAGTLRLDYAQPAEGKVEIYWNDQLAQTLYFVVR